MRLKLKGDYVKNSFEFFPCEIIIEFGKIQSIKPTNNDTFDNHIQCYDSDYNIEKIYYDKYLKNHKYTYRILYQNKEKKTKVINLNPSFIQLIKIKWAFRKYLIQSDEMKKDFLKYIIGGILGIFFTLITQEVKYRYKAEPIIPPKAANQHK